MSQLVQRTAETKTSSGVSRVTWGDEMNEMVQYIMLFEVEIFLVFLRYANLDFSDRYCNLELTKPVLLYSKFYVPKKIHY